MITQKVTEPAQECTFKLTSSTLVSGKVFSFKLKMSTDGSLVTYSTTTIPRDSPKGVIDRMLSTLPSTFKTTRSIEVSVDAPDQEYFTIYVAEGFKLVGSQEGSNVGIMSYLPAGFNWTDDPVNRIAPDISKQIVGFVPQEKPTNQFINYLYNVSGMATNALNTLAVFVRDRVGNEFIGKLQPYAGDNVPYGYLVCDGTEVPTTSEYNDYRAWVDSNAQYLRKNGKYFVPDCGGRSFVGVGSADGTGFGLGQTGGTASHLLLLEELPNHSHSVTVDNLISRLSGGNNSDYAGLAGTKTVTSSNTGGGQKHNNLSPYFVGVWLIRVFPNR